LTSSIKKEKSPTRFVNVLPTGKIVTGQKAMKIEDYLDTRNYRGLNVRGAGENE
jgi:hypothetical protein